jgi:hypothetical protein
VDQLKLHLRGWVSAILLAACASACDGPPAARPTSPEDAQKIARALSNVVGPPPGGYPLYRTATGAQMLDLRGRLQQVVVAGRAPDGSLRTTCVSSAVEAERFLTPVSR